MSGRSIAPRVLAACATLFGVAHAAHAQNAWFTGLGDLPGGGTYSLALDISRDGRHVAGSSDSGSGGFWDEPALWSDSGWEGLGFLPGGNRDGNAWGVSPEAGWVVGESGSAQGYQAFAWSRESGMFALGDLPGGDFRSTAYSVSRNGRVVVGKGTVSWNSQDASEAWRWTRTGGMQGLGTLPTTDQKPSSTAHGISADGSVIVGGSSITGGGVAFRWTESGGMIGLEDLPGGKMAGNAYAVSANGRWTVGFGDVEDDSGMRHREAALWNEQGGVVGLGFLTDDGGLSYHSIATGVSDNGRVVVGYADSDDYPSGDVAFLWTPENGLRPLTEVLLQDYGIDVAAMGWGLVNASAVTPDGRTIVGTGFIRGGGTQGWIVHLPDIPSPSTLPPLALAALLASRRRRASRPVQHPLLVADMDLDGFDDIITGDHGEDVGEASVSVLINQSFIIAP